MNNCGLPFFCWAVVEVLLDSMYSTSRCTRGIRQGPSTIAVRCATFTSVCTAVRRERRIEIGPPFLVGLRCCKKEKSINMSWEGFGIFCTNTISKNITHAIGRATKGQRHREQKEDQMTMASAGDRPRPGDGMTCGRSGGELRRHGRQAGGWSSDASAGDRPRSRSMDDVRPQRRRTAESQPAGKRAGGRLEEERREERKEDQMTTRKVR